MLPNVIFSHEEVNNVSRNDDRRLKLNDSSRPENWLYYYCCWYCYYYCC